MTDSPTWIQEMLALLKIVVRIQKTHLHLVALLLKLESKHPHCVRTSSRFETVQSHGHFANPRPRREQKEVPVPFLTDRIY